MLASFGTPARASDVSGASDPGAALRSYIQSIDAVQPAASVAERDFTGDIYAPLQKFSLQFSADQQPSLQGLPKLAEAGSLMEWLNQGGSASPSTMPAPAPNAKGKTTKAKGAAPVVPAT
jgi:hypothetical protein